MSVQLAHDRGAVTIQDPLPSEIHPKLKFREISFTNKVLRSCQIISKFCTEHGSVIAVLCAKFRNDLTTEIGLMGERDFARFEFKMIFVWISYIATVNCRIGVNR